MDLHAHQFGGTGRPVIILHGLFASGRNWASTGRWLAGSGLPGRAGLGRAVALDLRNHGDSPHSEAHTIDLMADDVERRQDGRGMAPAVLIGHSMGGHVAMAVALRDAEHVSALIVVDIAPRAYSHHHREEIAALRLDVGRLGRRAEVDRAMATRVADPALRRFLQMNLRRTSGGFRWALNAEALARYRADGGPFRGLYVGPTLFIVGEASSYFQDTDRALARSLFPAAEFAVIPGGDHRIHSSAKESFRAEVRRFLDSHGGHG